MNNKTLTLNKKECNQVLEHAINSNRVEYYMCAELSFAIIEYLAEYKRNKPASLPIDTLMEIIQKSFPEFTRENFKKFLESHYKSLLSDAIKVELVGYLAWLGHYPDAIKAKKAFLRTLIKD